MRQFALRHSPAGWRPCFGVGAGAGNAWRLPSVDSRESIHRMRSAGGCRDNIPKAYVPTTPLTRGRSGGI